MTRVARTGLVAGVLGTIGALYVGACSPGRIDPSAPAPDSELALTVDGDWPMYRHDLHSTWFNPAPFATSDALALQPSWTFTANSSTFAEPIVANGVVYFTTAGSKGGKIYAFDAATGAQRWVRSFGNTAIDPCTRQAVPAGIQGAPAVVNGVVYIDAADGSLYALDAATGATKWQAVISDPTRGETMVDSPVVSTALGKVFIATSAVSEDCLISPHVAAVDLATGAVHKATFLAPGHVGGSIWSSLTVDESMGRVFATTGNSPTGPSGDPLTQAFVAFDANTLAVVDHWQVPTRTTTDADFGASPTLFEAADGTKLIGTDNKDGWLYVLRRGNLAAGPVWKYQIAVYGGPEAGKSAIVAPSFADGVLYGAGEQTPSGAPGQVVAFEAGTGKVLWTHIGKGYVLPGMPIIGNVLVVSETPPGNATGSVVLLDRSNGAVLRTFPALAPVWGAPAATANRLLFTDMKGHLQTFALPGGLDGGVPDGGGLDGGGPDAGAGDGGSADGGGADGGAPDGGAGEQTLFHDSLTGSGGLGASWLALTGTYLRTAAGAQPQGTGSYATARVTPPEAQTVAATMTITQASRGNGVIARADATDPLYHHYAAYWGGDGTLWIARRDGATYTHLGHTGPIAPAPATHRLALRSVPTATAVELTLLLDGAPIFSVADTSWRRLRAPGTAGLFSYYGWGVTFRDFLLESP